MSLLASLVDKSPRLFLKVISAGPLKGIGLSLNAQGLENGLRGARDGYVYFGCKKYGDKNKSTGVSLFLSNRASLLHR